MQYCMTYYITLKFPRSLGRLSFPMYQSLLPVAQGGNLTISAVQTTVTHVTRSSVCPAHGRRHEKGWSIAILYSPNPFGCMKSSLQQSYIIHAQHSSQMHVSQDQQLHFRSSGPPYPVSSTNSFPTSPNQNQVGSGIGVPLIRLGSYQFVEINFN
ncbi:hypothetical protein L210DRAFT_2293559 [Boletus edulis BED1]|uniref:Uncharacterized protein n=1 Tax=Boletus edulis BED1 TaxID=1328754 RepID=A0AAD4BRY5_BOLED|nr:hypothetical protein L210DRAFT_2293559 [Boletus edulis BED1]